MILMIATTFIGIIIVIIIIIIIRRRRRRKRIRIIMKLTTASCNFRMIKENAYRAKS